MLVTQYNPHLLGTTDAITGPADRIVAVSPRTERLLIVTPAFGAARAGILELPGVAPNRVCRILETDRGVVVGDAGIAVLVFIDSTAPLELARVALPETKRGRWVVAGISLEETGRRISTDARRLIETVPSGTPRVRIVDNQSVPTVFIATNSGLVAYRIQDDEFVLTGSLESVTPRVETAAFDHDTGYLYVVDSGGQGAAVRLSVTGEPVVATRFSFPHIQGPVFARVIDSVLYIVNERRNALRALYLGDPENPVALAGYVPPPTLYWERSLVASQESGGVVTRAFGDLGHLLPYDLTITRSDQRVDTTFTAQWAVHGPLAKVSFRTSDLVAHIHLLTAELLVKARGIVDDDLRVRLGATTLSDTGFNLGWYIHDEQVYFPGPPASGTLLSAPAVFQSDHWRWVRIGDAILAANEVTDGDQIDVDLSNGWAGGYLNGGWDLEVVFTGGGTATADPALGTAAAVASGSVTVRPFFNFGVVAPVYDYYPAGHQFVPGPVVRAGGTSTFVVRLEGSDVGPFTYSFWVGPQYGPPAQFGPSNEFTTTVPADAEGVFVVSVIVSSRSGASTSTILTIPVQVP